MQDQFLALSLKTAFPILKGIHSRLFLVIPRYSLFPKIKSPSSKSVWLLNNSIYNLGQEVYYFGPRIPRRYAEKIRS